MDPKISLLIDAAERGDRSAVVALFAALYSELHGHCIRPDLSL